MLPIAGFTVAIRRCLLNTATLQAKKLAMPITPFERNIIADSLTLDTSKASFKQMDTDSNGEIDVSKLT